MAAAKRERSHSARAGTSRFAAACLLATRSLIAIIALATMAGECFAADPPSADDRAAHLEDFDHFCRFVGDDYAYFALKQTEWPAVCLAYREAAGGAVDRAAFISVVEHALDELYDPHAHLGTSTPMSHRLVPTNADLHAEWRDGHASIVDVRDGSAAMKAGVRAGMEVVSIDEMPMVQAIAARAPHHLRRPDPAADDWALDVALAGRQDRKPVRIATVERGTRATFTFVPDRPDSTTPLTYRRLDDVGIIAINNALGDANVVAAFDEALASLDGIRGLVLDLRDTPSGGTTAVARGIMSRLVATEAPFQKHEQVGEFRATGVRHVWFEYVEPRGKVFTGPVVVLVGHWTGSMGEGLAIGLNGARGAPVIGRPMAGLLGALDELRLPHADFVVRIPTEKLSHIDGTPREAFVPCVIDINTNAKDVALVQAAVLAHRMVDRPTIEGKPYSCR